MEYTSEDYEFAIRILHHRKEVDEQELIEWMKEPEHLELLQEMAAVRMETDVFKQEEIQRERKRLFRRLNRRIQIGWVSGIAASILLFLGIWQMLGIAEPIFEESVVVAEKVKIVPGNSKAQLILANGKVVDLYASVREVAGTDNSVVWNDSINGLRYQAKAISQRGEKEEYNTLQVPVGGFYKLELSDGTKVWLNAKSELYYPVSFGEKERCVYLKGEGYFEVTRDQKRPFRVYLEQSEVTVLGTIFNISAYPDEPAVYTTLVSGSVQIQADKSSQKVVLKPGLQSVMDNVTGKTAVREVDPQMYTAWVGGRFVFRFINLETIIHQLQRWYDFDIVWLSPEIKNYEFQGVIQKDSRIEDVFKAIELATDVKFKIMGKQVTVERK